MERTLYELLAQTSAAQKDSMIVATIDGARSAEEADREVGELEFPTPIVREARLLFKIKRAWPTAFEEIKKKLGIGEKPVIDFGERTFPISYGSGLHYQDMLDGYGSLLVKPDPLLPPIFWNYTLLDENGDVIYSTEEGVGEKHKHGNLGTDGVECALAHGSRSLPASLNIRFLPELDGFKVEFSVTAKSIGCSPKYRNVFTWTRHISKNYIERFERTTSQSEWGESEHRTSFRMLTEEEAKLFDRVDKGITRGSWALFLETRVNAPLDEEFSEYLSFLVTTIYLTSSNWRERMEEGGCHFNKLDWAYLLHRPLALDFLSIGQIPFISHTGIKKNNGQRIRTCHTTVEKAVHDISLRTPNQVNGVAALWYFFGFKSTSSTNIYNMQTTDEIRKRGCDLDSGDALPLWRPEKLRK